MAQHYDVAVLGSQPAGIIAAALAAKRGRRVLLVGHGAGDGAYQAGPWRLPRGPEVLAALDSSPAALRVHELLGIGAELRAMGRAALPTFHGLMPGARVAFGGSPSQLGAELAREFPALARPMEHLAARLGELDVQVAAFLRAAPPLPPEGVVDYLRARLASARLAPLAAPFDAAGPWDGVPAGHPLRRLLSHALPFFGHLWARSPSVLHAARLLGALARGAAGIAGGRGGLRQLLLAAARRAGVELHLGARLLGLTCSRRRITGIALADERQALRADLYVDNAGGELAPLLPEGSAARARLAAFEARPGPRGQLEVVNIVVPAQAVPRGMAAAVLLAGDADADADDGAAGLPLFVHRYALWAGRTQALRGHGGDHDAPHELLCIARPRPPGAVALPRLAPAALARLATEMPFLAAAPVATSVPPVPVSGHDWDVRHPLWGEAAAPWLGALGLPARTPLQNVVHCGHALAPGLGLEGEYLAGLSAARALEEKVGRRWF